MAFIDWGRWAALNKDKGEEMAAKTLQESQGVFGKADSELSKASRGQEYNESAINEADAKRKALQSISGIQGEKKGVSLFDAALQQGSTTMGNAYAAMGDHQERLKAAQKQATDRTAAAQRFALEKMRMADSNAAVSAQHQREIDEFDRKRAELERERLRRDVWPGYESGGDYAGYSDYREEERQKSKPTRQKSIWDFFGR